MQIGTNKMVEIKRRGFREWLLWHVFGLVPYLFLTIDGNIIFYASVKNAQRIDRFMILLEKSKIGKSI